jgi:ribosome-associated translation inhibitor RaiA
MRTSQTSSNATMTEIIEGPITATDRVYAFDKIRQVYPRAPSPVRRARARLTARPQPSGSCPATAECTLVLEDGLIVSAGAIGSSVRDAVDELMTRLRRRLVAPSARHSDGRAEGIVRTLAASGTPTAGGFVDSTRWIDLAGFARRTTARGFRHRCAQPVSRMRSTTASNTAARSSGRPSIGR